MRLLSWLRDSRGGERPPPAPRPRLRVEALEDRWVPATLRVNHDFSVHAPADAMAQHGTLQWAVANAHDGDTILLTADVQKTGISLTQGELLLTQRNLTITTDPGAAPVTIDANHLSRVFEVAPGASVTLSNLAITGGNAPLLGGGIYANYRYGGGILVDSGAVLTVIGSTIYGNGDLVNHTSGGGMANFGTTVVAGGSRVSGNFSEEAGGGVFSTGPMAIADSAVSGNFSIEGGGIFNDGPMTISGSTVSGNGSNETGGGIFNIGSMTITSSSVSGNSSGEGAGSSITGR